MTNKINYLTFFAILLVIAVIPLTTMLTNTRTTIEQHAAPNISNKIYYGAFVSGSDPKDSDLSLQEAFEKDAQKGLSITQWYESWAGASRDTTFPTTWMDLIRNHGTIPMITWQPAAGTQTQQKQFRLETIIDGAYDLYITQFARTAKAWGHPFFLRFAHEMNGNWYPWSEGVNGNTTGQYEAMWIHVHNIFVKEGVTNATWVWCPITGSSYQTLKELYPGDQYVDWTCLDGYNREGNSWHDFTSVFKSSYDNLTRLSSKPVMIGEAGTVEYDDKTTPIPGDTKAAWIRDALTVALPASFPNVKAFLWFNSNKGNGSNYSIESSAQAQTAFATSIQNAMYLGNQFSSLQANPIRSPQ